MRSRRRWGMVLLRGRSMMPTLRDGDRLLVRYAAPDSGPHCRPAVGDLVLIRFADGEVSVKRVELAEADGVMVTRDNPHEGRDSWTLGGVAIPYRNVLGSIRVRLWPRPGRVR